MKNIIIVAGLFSLLCWGCQKEDTPSPSNADPDRVLMFADMSKPLVKEYYEKYGCGILCDFDIDQDVRFFMGTVREQEYWELLVVDKFERLSVIDSALNTIDTMILKYFKDEMTFQGKTYKSDFKKRYFPTKIILSPRIENQSLVELGSFTTESTCRASENGLGALHCLGNINSFVFNMNPDMIYRPGKYKEFKNDGLYVFLTNMIHQHNLYSEIPEEFYSASKNVYGRRIRDIQESNGDPVHDISRMDYMKFGFIPRVFDPYSFSSYSSLPTKELDVRIYINELINPYFLDYCDTVHKKKMKLLAMTLVKWGIDIFVINPAMEDLCKDN